MSRGFHRLSRRGVGAIGLLLGLVLWAMPARAQCALNTTPPSLVQVGGGSFTVPGLMPSRSQLTIGGGITAQLTDTLAFEAAYHITPPTGNLLSQTISLGLDYRF